MYMYKVHIYIKKIVYHIIRLLGVSLVYLFDRTFIQNTLYNYHFMPLVIVNSVSVKKIFSSFMFYTFISFVYVF